MNKLPGIGMMRGMLCGAVALWMMAGAQAADWPGYRGLTANGVSEETITATDWSDAKALEVWRVPTVNGFSSLAVGGGGAYTLVSRESADGVMLEYCIGLDAATGKELWATELGQAKYDGGGGDGDGPRATPAIDGDRLYVLDARLVLSCLDRASGAVVWKKDIVGEFGGKLITWQNAASALVERGMVYVAGGGAGQSLLAFDKDGNKAWGVLDETMTHATPIAATIQGVRQVIFLTQAGLVALDPPTGKLLWRQEFAYNTSTAASPVVWDDMVYVSAGYGTGAGVFRITKAGGALQSETVWLKPNELINHWSTPVAKDGYLYGMYGFKVFKTAPLKCIEMATGKEMWSHDGFGQGNCILVGGHVLALSDEGALVLAEAKPDAYKEVARLEPAVAGKCWSMPAFSDGRAYIRSTVEAVCLQLGEKK